MKKQYFIILIACLFVGKTIAQQVEQQQRSLVTKRTADWCPYCGTWGWDYFVGAIEQNGDKAVYMAAHYDGNLADPAAEAITDNWGGFYQPKFFLGEVQQGVSLGNVTAKLAELKQAIDANFDQAPLANTGFEPVYANGEIKVDAKVRFFQAAQGDFYLGIYLLEDNVVAYQASIGNNAEHKRLFRKSFTAETFGKPITNGNVAADTEFSLSFSLSTDDPSQHEYEVVGVIWRKDGDKYIPVNVWSTWNIETLSGTDGEPITFGKLAVQPTIATDASNILVELAADQSVATLDVLDTNGRLLATLSKGRLAAGQHSFKLSREAVGSAGLYLVRLTTPDFVKVEKVIFR